MAGLASDRRRVVTTPTGVPITLCAECQRWLREQPQGVRHCIICGRAFTFINDDGRCLAPACREAE